MAVDGRERAWRGPSVMYLMNLLVHPFVLVHPPMEIEEEHLLHSQGHDGIAHQLPRPRNLCKDETPLRKKPKHAKGGDNIAKRRVEEHKRQ